MSAERVCLSTTQQSLWENSKHFFVSAHRPVTIYTLPAPRTAKTRDTTTECRFMFQLIFITVPQPAYFNENPLFCMPSAQSRIHEIVGVFSYYFVFCSVSKSRSFIKSFMIFILRAGDECFGKTPKCHGGKVMIVVMNEPVMPFNCFRRRNILYKSEEPTSAPWFDTTDKKH